MPQDNPCKKKQFSKFFRDSWRKHFRRNKFARYSLSDPNDPKWSVNYYRPGPGDRSE